MSLATSMEQLRQDRALLERLIEQNGLGAQFQPVRDLADGTVVGWKAVAKGPTGTNVESPAGLLTSAKATGYVERLDWMFRCNAFDAAVAAKVTVDVFVTPEFETYGSPCPPRLAVSFGRARRTLRVVADVAARAFDDPGLLRRGVEEFRSYGWRIAVDDVADRPDALALLPALQPDAVRVDMALPGRAAGAGRRAGVTALLDWAQASGTPVLADNVDSELHRGEARSLGAVAGRGRLLGPPGPLTA